MKKIRRGAWSSLSGHVIEPGFRHKWKWVFPHFREPQALGYLGVVDRRQWGWVPSRLSDAWILVHQYRRCWRMCAVTYCVVNAGVPTRQATACGGTHLVVPLSWFSSESQRLALRNLPWSLRTDVIILSHVFVNSRSSFRRMDVWHSKVGLTNFNPQDGRTCVYIYWNVGTESTKAPLSTNNKLR